MPLRQVLTGGVGVGVETSSLESAFVKQVAVGFGRIESLTGDESGTRITRETRLSWMPSFITKACWTIIGCFSERQFASI